MLLQSRVHKNNITRIEENNLFLLNIPKIPIFKLIQTTESCKDFRSCARISFPLIITILFKVLLQVSFYWKVLSSVPSTSTLFPVASEINCFFLGSLIMPYWLREGPSFQKNYTFRWPAVRCWKQRLICFSHVPALWVSLLCQLNNIWNLSLFS